MGSKISEFAGDRCGALDWGRVDGCRWGSHRLGCSCVGQSREESDGAVMQGHMGGE